MKKLLILALAALLHSMAAAQYLDMPPALETALRGKTRFADIMKEVDDYYNRMDYKKDRQLLSSYKKWNRWAWWAVRHLNSRGEPEYDGAKYFEEAARMEQQRTESPASSGGLWSPVGPTSTTWGLNRGSRGIGRVDRLAFHPTNASIILAATPAGGLWRTIDGGASWLSISHALPNCGISGVLFSNDDPSGNKIYILTGDGDSGPGSFVASFGYRRSSYGVLVTTNGGITWQKAGNSQSVFQGKSCFKLIQARNFPNVLLAATSTGVYGSYDFGGTWARVSQYADPIQDIEQHPVNDAVFYAAGGSHVYKSSDYGQSFAYLTASVFSPVLSSSTRGALAVTPAAPDEVYFLQCSAGYNRIYKSVNSAGNFTSINSADLITGQYSYNCSFAISPVNINLMVAGGINVTASSSNGNTFPSTTVGIIGNTPPPNYVHPDIHDLAYSPLNGLLYAATDGGIWRSSDNGINWTDISNGLQCTQYYHMDGFNGTANLFAGGAQDNGSAYTTNGATMNYFGSGDGFAVDFPATDNDYIYIVENTAITRLRRSTSALSGISPGTAAQQTFYPNIIAHPTNNDIVYAGYGSSMWRSADKGNNWTQISTNGTSGSGGGHTGGFAVSAQTPDRLYAANAAQLWRSDNQGTAFTQISGNTGWPAAFGVMTDLAARPSNADEIWVTTTGNNGANRVLYSSNAGASWVDFTGTLPNVPVYSIVCTSDGDVYAGTELGVYFMDFDMNDWVPFYNGMPMVPVSDLFVDEANSTITAATFGRGLWRSDLYSACSALPALSGGLNGRHFYQSSAALSTSHQMNGSVGNELRYRSPVSVRLTNGFRVGNGAYMRAVIGPCGQGVFSRSNAAITKATHLRQKGAAARQ